MIFQGYLIRHREDRGTRLHRLDDSSASHFGRAYGYRAGESDAMFELIDDDKLAGLLRQEILHRLEISHGSQRLMIVLTITSGRVSSSIVSPGSVVVNVEETDEAKLVITFHILMASQFA